jgi:hypothetical protein
MPRDERVLQDINLLEALPKPEFLWPTLQHAFILWGVLLGSVVCLQAYKWQSLSQLRSEVASLEGKEDQLLKKIKNPIISAKYARGKERQVEEPVAIVARNQLMDQDSFYDALFQLTLRPLASSWLSKIVIDRKMDSIQFHGYAIRAQSVYRFIDSLQHLAVFKGKVFNVLSLDLDKKNTVVIDGAVRPLIKFSLLSGKAKESRGRAKRRSKR